MKCPSQRLQQNGGLGKLRCLSKTAELGVVNPDQLGVESIQRVDPSTLLVLIFANFNIDQSLLDRFALLPDLVRLLVIYPGNTLEQVTKRDHAVFRLAREIGAAKKRQTILRR